MRTAPPTPIDRPSRLAVALDELVLIAVLVALLAAAQLGATRAIGPGGVFGLAALSPDGRLVATSTSFRYGVFEADGGGLRYLIPGSIFELGFSPDGRWLGTIGFDDAPTMSGWLRILEAESGRTALEMPFAPFAPFPGVHGWSIAPDGDHVAAIHEGGRISIGSLSEGRWLRELTPGTPPTTRIAWLERDRLLLVPLDLDAQVQHLHIIDARSGASLVRLPRPESPLPETLVLSEDGRRFALHVRPRGGGARLRLRDSDTGEELAVVDDVDALYDISRDGRHLLVRMKGAAVIWDVERREAEARVPRGARARAARLVDGDRRVVLVTSDGELWSWDRRTGAAELRVAAFRLPYGRLALLQAGGFAVWLLAWAFVCRRRLRHPDRPAALGFGAFALPIVAAGFLALFLLAGLATTGPSHRTSEAGWLLSLGAAGAFLFTSMFGITVVIVWAKNRFRGRTILMGSSIGIVIWMWTAAVLWFT